MKKYGTKSLNTTSSDIDSNHDTKSITSLDNKLNESLLSNNNRDQTMEKEIQLCKKLNN